MRNIQEVENIQDSIVLAKKLEIGHFLAGNLLRVYISSLIILKAC